MSDAEKKVDANAKAPAPKRLHPSRFKPGGYLTQDWECTADPGTTEEDIKNPAFFQHWCDKLKPCARIRIHSADMTFYAEAYVIAVQKLSAQVQIMHYTKLDPVALMKAEDIEIAYAGPHDKWRAQRKDNRQVITKGHETREACAMALLGSTKAA